MSVSDSRRSFRVQSSSQLGGGVRHVHSRYLHFGGDGSGGDSAESRRDRSALGDEEEVGFPEDDLLDADRGVEFPCVGENIRAPCQLEELVHEGPGSGHERGISSEEERHRGLRETLHVASDRVELAVHSGQERIRALGDSDHPSQRAHEPADVVDTIGADREVRHSPGVEAARGDRIGRAVEPDHEVGLERHQSFKGRFEASSDRGQVSQLPGAVVVGAAHKAVSLPQRDEDLSGRRDEGDDPERRLLEPDDPIGLIHHFGGERVRPRGGALDTDRRWIEVTLIGRPRRFPAGRDEDQGRRNEMVDGSPAPRRFAQGYDRTASASAATPQES